MSTSRYERELDLEDLNSAHTLGVLSIPPGSRVLDIGAANRSVARGLVERGCKVWAIDIDPGRAREAEAFCEQVAVGDVETLDIASAFDGAEFDAVLLLDVLEHLRNPLAVLRHCGAVVGSEGRLVISTSNVAHAAVRLALLDGRFRYTEGGLLDATHLRFFDRVGVERLLDDAGLVVVENLRTTAELTETEIAIDPGSFPDEVVAEATRDADSNTYQFVFVATPRDGAGALSGSLAPELQRRVEELERRIRELQAGARDFRFLRDDLRLKEAYIVELRTERAELERALRASERSLELVQQSLSWRITVPLRSLRARLRGRGTGAGRP